MGDTVAALDSGFAAVVTEARTSVRFTSVTSMQGWMSAIQLSDLGHESVAMVVRPDLLRLESFQHMARGSQ